MKGCSNALLEDSVISFGLWHMLLGSAVIHLDGRCKVILDIIHQRFKLPVTVDLTDSKTIAVVKA